ncbi:MAG: hypothetical protein R2705_24060 [Ilumatobacteraceae bacterium]
MVAQGAYRDAEQLERRMRPPEESERAERLQFSLGLDLAQAQELFSMTPLRWQSVPPRRDRRA